MKLTRISKYKSTIWLSILVPEQNERLMTRKEKDWFATIFGSVCAGIAVLIISSTPEYRNDFGRSFKDYGSIGGAVAVVAWLTARISLWLFSKGKDKNESS